MPCPSITRTHHVRHFERLAKTKKLCDSIQTTQPQAEQHNGRPTVGNFASAFRQTADKTAGIAGERAGAQNLCAILWSVIHHP